jgi:dienelactone hydrolase
VVLSAALAYTAVPYTRAASLVARAADIGGAAEALANRQAHAVTRAPRHLVPTRHGEVPAQFYTPDARAARTAILIPGIHSMGIDEPRLTALAGDLAATGVQVMTLALPDLQEYRITPQAADVIEDAVLWTSRRVDEEKVALVGISFAGGLSVAAAGRPTIRDRLSYVLSFGGHGNLARVMRYLATGEAPAVDGLEVHPPHDYGVAVILYGLAPQVVPSEQVEALRHGITTFLLASQLTLVDTDAATATFAQARELQAALPEPSATYMTYVNDRAVGQLGPVLAPHLPSHVADDPSLSPEAAPPPTAPVYLLHGDGDTVIPAAESALLAAHLRRQHADVRVLMSGVITHAEADRSAPVTEVWKLIRFWASVLRH